MLQIRMVSSASLVRYKILLSFTFAILLPAPKAMVVLLREGAARHIKDNKKRKAIDIAKYKKFLDCIGKLSQPASMNFDSSEDF